MSDKVIVTIGRQYGSGGHDIGKKLAQRMGVICYDKELIELASKESGLAKEIFNEEDESPSNSLLYSLVMDAYSFGSNPSYSDMPINQKVFLSQYEEIKKIAAMDASCIIVGRCADYVLEDNEDVISVFISASKEARIKRIMERHNVTAKKAESLIKKTDKKRKSYYNYYSDKEWESVASYDLCIDSSKIGEEGVIEMILAYIDIKQKHKRHDI